MMHTILVMPEGSLGEGQAKQFNFGPRKGIIYNDAGMLKAYENACTHMGGTTDLQGDVLHCRMHHAEFDPCTGARLCGQAPEGSYLPSLKIKIENGNVFVLWEIFDAFE